MANVLLLQMPFGSLQRPNLGLSLLKRVIEAHDHRCGVTYPNILFAQRIGIETYEVISRNLPPEYLFGEYVFSPSAFDHEVDYVAKLKDLTAHINTSTGGYTSLPDWLVTDSDRLVRSAREFLLELVDTINWSTYDLIGLSSTFHQTAACIGLARLIKTKSPNTRIILGGANCEAEMGAELHRAFPVLDFVCLGEGERLVVDVLSRIDSGATSFDGIPGLAWRVDTGATVVNSLAAEPVMEMDDQPDPDYHDWIDELKNAGTGIVPQALPWQTSRGCWYGAKHHCIFCGLSGQGMTFRSMSPNRVLAQLAALAEYGITFFYSVDCVLDHQYFRTLLPRLHAEEHGCKFFFETRPTLTREQVRSLRDAGIIWIQPGIESLSSRSLRRMNKGVSACQNVLLLKYAAESEVGIMWNILYGFPGESADELEEMMNLMPLISHLQAPSIGCHRIRMDRFSPMHTRPADFGLTNVRPFPTYGVVFPLDEKSLARIAYYFTCEYTTPAAPEEVALDLADATRVWQNSAGHAALIYIEQEEQVLVFDTRTCAVGSQFCLEGTVRDVFLACDTGATPEFLQKHPLLSKLNWRHALDDLISKKLVVELDGRFVNLAVRMSLDPSDSPHTASLSDSGAQCLELYLERMRVMREQIVRMKIRAAD